MPPDDVCAVVGGPRGGPPNSPRPAHGQDGPGRRTSGEGVTAAPQPSDETGAPPRPGGSSRGSRTRVYAVGNEAPSSRRRRTRPEHREGTIRPALACQAVRLPGAVAAAESSSSEAGFLPAGIAADDVTGASEAQLDQCVGGENGGVAVVAEQDDLLVEVSQMGVAPGTLQIDAPLEHGAWDVNRAGRRRLAPGRCRSGCRSVPPRTAWLSGLRPGRR